MAEDKGINMSPAALEEVVAHPMRRSSDMKEVPITIGRLEQSIESTNLALRDLATRTSSNIDKLADSIKELNRNQFLGKQTNWGMIASWVGVSVLLLGLIVYQPLQEIRGAIQVHSQDGHPASVITRVENNEIRFADIIARLQREITLLETSDTERNFQITNRVATTEEWILEHNSISSQKHAVLETRIDSLKESIDKIEIEVKQHPVDINSLMERVLDIEREIYAGAAYRAGRPIKPLSVISVPPTN